MNRKFLYLVSLFISLPLIANDQITVTSPQSNQDLTNSRLLKLDLRVHVNTGMSTKIILTRKENNVDMTVNEAIIDTRFAGIVSSNVTPPFHFCESTYTLKLLNGQNQLIKTITFKAGVGTCNSPDRNKFINLEKNLPELTSFTPSNQGNRDTCGAFASASALEAAYKRIKGIDLRLSQNYIHHIIKSTWLTPGPLFLYENQSSFFGGNSTKDALRFLEKYRVPLLRFAPYQTQDQLANILSNLGIPNFAWNSNPQNNRITQDQIDALEYHPSHIPLLARQNAIYGVSESKYHEETGLKSLTGIENYLKAGKEVIFSIRLLWSDNPLKSKTKIYNVNGSGESHLMLAVGYDKVDQTGPYLLVKNSWGDGVIRVHYDILKNQNMVSYGVIERVTETHFPHPSRWIGRWEMKHDHWRGELIIRRTAEANIENRGPEYRIGEYHHQNGKRYCAYGGFTNGSTRLLMKINFNQEILDKNFNITFSQSRPSVNVIAKDVCPPTPSGQSFTIDMGLSTHNRGTGTTVWDNRNFPVEIWR